MTYLELAQMVARESGTVSGVAPSTVTGQTGRLAKIVEWVNSAWNDIQVSETEWRWMIDDFSVNTVASTNEYTASDASLTRWARWRRRADSMTLYKSSIGVSDEGPIRWMDWHEFKGLYRRGTLVETRPVAWSIDPTGKLQLGPTPDDVYVVQGEYIKTPQTLSIDGDIPEMPVQFHRLIGWEALQLLAKHDEGDFQVSIAASNALRLWTALRQAELTVDMHWPEALA